MNLYTVRIQADWKPKSPYTTTVKATALHTAVARAIREFTSGPAKGKRSNKSWGIRVDKVLWIVR